ncbi:MAG: type II toxin-antitoxin system RelE/ParE family toxin [Roseiflexaceae bacterium]
MRIVITNAAQNDLDGHFDYIFEHNPDAAERIYNAIVGRIRGLRDTPHIGRPGRVQGTRELVISSTPYLVIYEVSTDEITILHVMHGRQEWPRQ